MKKNKQSKWFALVILLCISIGAKAQMPQTPQDILNMAAGSLQFDFSGYFNGQQQQQYHNSNRKSSRCKRFNVEPATAEGVLRAITTLRGLPTCSGHIVPSVEPLVLQDTIIIIVRAVMERDMFTATTKRGNRWCRNFKTTV